MRLGSDGPQLGPGALQLVRGSHDGGDVALRHRPVQRLELRRRVCHGSCVGAGGRSTIAGRFSFATNLTSFIRSTDQQLLAQQRHTDDLLVSDVSSINSLAGQINALNSQIAKVLSCSESAVKSLLFRAYETLRMRLAHMA